MIIGYESIELKKGCLKFGKQEDFYGEKLVDVM